MLIMHKPTALEVTGLNAAYGESKVLFNINLKLHTNEIISCVGRNGSGKTTLLKSISGFLLPTSGEVKTLNRQLVGLRPYQIAQNGVKYVPQDKKVFSDLTVRENLELGSYASGDYNWDPVFDYFPKLKILIDRKAGFLSGGERQMLMIGRAILGKPEVLLIDEPTEGLAPSIVTHLRHVFTDLSQRASLIIVEQNLPLVCAISNRIYAIREGHIVAELQASDGVTPTDCEQYL
jgi:ABC-type branched-subunit amino acid transport system ATPase component